MDLLDRYLEAVKKHLPWQRQDDIIAELRANLESQLEDKEAGLGRPLTTGEAEAWLKQIGAPMQVAARYQPQRYLIGPAVFPIYWRVMQLALTWALIIYSIVVVVEIFSGQNPNGTALLEAVLRVPGVLMTVAVWVTLIFAVLEFVAEHYPEKLKRFPIPISDWLPASLPPVEKAAASGKRPRSYASAVAEVIFGFLFLVWLLLVPQHPYLLLGPGAAYLSASPFQFAPVCVQFYWCVVALNVLQLGWRAENLWRGRWQRPQTAQKMTTQALGLVPLLLLLTVRDHACLLLKNPALDQVRYGGTLDSINQWIFRVALFIFTIAVLQLVWELGRMSLNVYRRRAAAAR